MGRGSGGGGSGSGGDRPVTRSGWTFAFARFSDCAMPAAFPLSWTVAPILDEADCPPPSVASQLGVRVDPPAEDVLCHLQNLVAADCLSPSYVPVVGFVCLTSGRCCCCRTCALCVVCVCSCVCLCLLYCTPSSLPSFGALRSIVFIQFLFLRLLIVLAVKIPMAGGKRMPRRVQRAVFVF